MIIGHPGNIQVFWVILIFLFIEKIIRHGKLIYGIILGIILSLTLLSALEYFLYLTFILPLYLIFRDIKLFYNLKFLKTMLIAFLVFLLSSGWYLNFFIGKEYKIRTVGENLEISVRNIQFINTRFFPLFLFTSFLGALISIKERLTYTLPFLVIGTFSLIYSLGPFSKFAPHYFFFQFWPYVNAFRTPYRILIFFIISISVFTSVFIQKIYKKNKNLAYVLTTFCVIYFLSQLPMLNSAKFYNYPIGKTEFYKNISKIEGNFSLVEFPNKWNCWYVYNIILHTKNLIGGCAAVEPQSFLSFKEKCGELINISKDCEEEIKKLNLRYAIYNAEDYSNWNEIYQSLNSSKFLILQANYENLFMFKIKESVFV
jgi:hypothetical protein